KSAKSKASKTPRRAGKKTSGKSSSSSKSSAAASKRKKLTAKQEAFTENYLGNGFNGVQAARDAGYGGDDATQNLIWRYSVVYRIWKQRARVLTNRKLTDPVPAVRNLKTEPRAVGGLVKDVVLSGEPTWAFYDLRRVQEEIDTMGLPAFEAECQHNVEQNKTGLTLQQWDEKVHVITWSEFAAVYGERAVPKHWRKHIGHDWGNTHPCVVSAVATAAENSRLPGLHFVFGGLTFPQNTLADDVALATIERFAPHVNTSTVRKLAAELLAKWSADRVTEILDAPRQAAQRIVKAQVETWLATDPSWVMWHMSHEQANVRGIYREFYGLPWQPCNPKAASGIEQ